MVSDPDKTVYTVLTRTLEPHYPTQDRYACLSVLRVYVKWAVQDLNL
jgi:hypothetical protein